MLPGATSLSNVVDQTSQLNININALIKANEENNILKNKLNLLSLKEQDYQETLLENQRLKNALEFKQGAGSSFISARIIGQTPSVESRGLIIDKGQNQGIVKDMPVVANQDYNLGVVGRIAGVDFNSATVLLISDEGSEISAMAQRSREQGVVSGAGNLTLKMKYLLPEADIQTGDIIVTSGFGGIFPKGICLGTVKEINKKPYFLYDEVLVQPSIKVNRLEELFIIKKLNLITDFKPMGPENIQQKSDDKEKYSIGKHETIGAE